LENIPGNAHLPEHQLSRSLLRLDFLNDVLNGNEIPLGYCARSLQNRKILTETGTMSSKNQKILRKIEIHSAAIERSSSFEIHCKMAG
jgi:hypothetical protein